MTSDGGAAQLGVATDAVPHGQLKAAVYADPRRRNGRGHGWQTSQRMPVSAAHSAAKPSIGIDAVGRGFVAWFEDGGACFQ